jgi:hypothetical protein
MLQNTLKEEIKIERKDRYLPTLFLLLVIDIT